ncbi:MAG: alpha/beta hydrolase [Betaproteobacteria bacterium]|nr:alpha/beta hydrolase [Betaproteobacteria bacterium]
MQISVNGHTTYAYTGGKDFNPAQPTVVLIHGVLCDHSVWALQSRYLAHHGWNVLAIDLPGHCKSAGPPPASVPAAAAFIQALLDAQGVQQAALVGHSFGSLIALQAAANLGQRITHLVMVGTAYPMKVSPALLDAALNQPEKALHMTNVFSRATLAPPSGAGTWVFGASLALGRRVLASNPEVNLFHTGFKACHDYEQGLQAMTDVTCPVMMVLGVNDQMTTPKNAQPLVAQALDKGIALEVVMIPNGHHQMSESPDETLDAIKRFLA